MPERLPPALEALASALGVTTVHRDGLGRTVEVSAETVVAVCAALGAGISEPDDAGEALRAHRAAAAVALPPVVVAWDGRLEPFELASGARSVDALVTLEGGGELVGRRAGSDLRVDEVLPPGYHRLAVDIDGRRHESALISAPTRSWRRRDDAPRWGVAAHLAALRSNRSHSVGDLTDLAGLGRWLGTLGADVVSVLPLLPTFNDDPAEPSPYSPVSRLFWNELMLDLGSVHRPVGAVASLDVGRADTEVRAALAGVVPPVASGAIDAELVRYARFRGTQAMLGRNWHAWPAPLRDGGLDPALVDPDEERFHLVAQLEARRQLADLTAALGRSGVTLGLDLAVGVHADGYDTWARPGLFAPGVSVGAPPDAGFPSGQDWGFPPIHPRASQAEGHAYLAASTGHQAAVAGVLRLDHVMAMTRLYWIPHGFDCSEGAYVAYPADELFAVLSLESHCAACELVGENLGTVPPDIDAALPRHGIRGMYLAEFEAAEVVRAAPAAEVVRAAPAAEDGPIDPPSADQVSMIGTHDTPTFAGWLDGADIDERVATGLLAPSMKPAEVAGRAGAVKALAGCLGVDPADPAAFRDALLDWLATSPSPLLMIWLEDLWLERNAVNLPGTSSAQRANWQRPMARLLDEIMADPGTTERLEAVDRLRKSPPG